MKKLLSFLVFTSLVLLTVFFPSPIFADPKGLPAAKTTPDTITTETDKATLTIAIPPSDLATASQWGVVIRCGPGERYFPRYLATKGADSLTVNLTKTTIAGTTYNDCEFQTASGIGIDVYKINDAGKFTSKTGPLYAFDPDGGGSIPVAGGGAVNIIYGRSQYSVANIPTTKRGAAITNPNPIKNSDNQATIKIPIPSSVLSTSNQWSVTVRCGVSESVFPRYDPPNVRVVSDGIEFTITNDRGVLNNDCEFQDAGTSTASRSIDIDVYKLVGGNRQNYGKSFYNVGIGTPQTLPDAITVPSPILESSDDAVITIPIPNKTDLSSSNWKVQIRCGALGRFPDPYDASKGLTKTSEGIKFTIHNDRPIGGNDCEFNGGDPIDVDVFTVGNGPGGQDKLYGRTQYNPKKSNSASVYPPPCTKWVQADNPSNNVTLLVEAARKDNTLDKLTLDYKCVEVSTAVATFDTTPTGFIKSLFGILLSLAGGIALLLIIYAAFQLLVSQGNPEKVQGARETITSAIIGLLFLIFSLTILQIIGVEILHIPGLGK